MDTAEIQRIISNYYRQPYANNMDSLEEMDKFLERNNLPRLNQEEIENMNRPSSEIETVIKNLSTTKVQERTSSQVNSIKHLVTRYHPPFSTLPKNAEVATLSNSFYEATTILILKPDKDITKKENYRPISLMNIGAKILNKILSKQNPTTHKKNHTPIKWDLHRGARILQYMQTNQCDTPQ